MSLIDTTFGPLAPRLITKWGQPVQFVQRTEGEYDADTGHIESAEQRHDITAVITKVTAEEVAALGQAADVKIYINPQELPQGTVISVSDEVVIPSLLGKFQGDQAKVVDVKVVRGQGPLLWVVMARYQ